MKQFIFLLLALSFISGCNFLSEGETQLSAEDSLTLEEENLDDFVIEEDEMDEDLDDDMDEDGMESDEELEDDIDEDETDEGETEKSKKGKGFFSWLFGDSDEEESDEELDSEFIGEDEDFSSAERDYEDYEEDTDKNTEDYSAAESIQTDIPEQDIPQEDTSATIETEMDNTETTKAVKKQTTPLNKIITVPYMKAGKIINAVYIARPDEDLTGISQKIYGKNEVEQLLKINTHLQNRSVVVGDKIYYNSPNRPNDNNRILFYYQDNNISPSYYNLSSGDNIRKVASQLLGHPKSWKEIWATNPNLKSKSEVADSLSIVYWPQSATQLAYNNPPTPDIQPSQPQSDEKPLQNPNQIPPPAESLMPNEELNNQQKLPPEEDFEQPDSNNIPPVQEQIKESKGIIKELLNNVEMIVGIIAFLILLYLIIHIIIKKRKQRDFDYTATNIEM
ncbi:MAG: hypothetical protein OXJ52_07770 [Oligoflexia bacterium]|nr:hypothetical protein [Oligoflexia bacterium]